jgi:hypothetical protein
MLEKPLVSLPKLLIFNSFASVGDRTPVAKSVVRHYTVRTDVELKPRISCI